MLALDNGDKIRGDASSATVVDFTIHGVVGTTITQLADGQLAAAIGDLYTAGATVIVTSITLVNTDTVDRTVNLYLTPSGGTARRLIPKTMTLAAGYSLMFDGAKFEVINTSGQILSSKAGGVVGPASSTDNAVVRFDGATGKIIQNSGIIVSDVDAVTGVTSLTVDNVVVNGNDISSTSGNLTLTPVTGSNITLDGTITVDAGVVAGVTSITSSAYVGLPASVYLGAEAAYLPATNPAVFNEVAGATTYAGWSYLAFDKTTAQTAVWRVPLPDYNGGNIIVTAYAKAQTTPAGNVTGQFDIHTIGLATGEEYNAAVLTDTTVNLSLAFTTSTHEHHVVIASATIDPANVAADDLLCIGLVRDVTTDDLDSDLQLLGILLEYTRT